MKILLKRHASEFHVLRSLAIAQAIKALGHEVFVECLAEYAPLVQLVDGIKWKNPIHPHAYPEARQFKNSSGKLTERKSGPLYDRLIDIDADGPFDGRFVASGLDWWSWALAVTREDFPNLTPAAFPDLSESAVNGPANTGQFCLISLVSAQSDPSAWNLVAVEEWAKAKYGLPVSYLAPDGLTMAAGKAHTSIGASYGLLARLLASAGAVVSVNGISAVLAQCTAGGAPLVKRFAYLRDPKPTRARPLIWETVREGCQCPPAGVGTEVLEPGQLTIPG